MDNGGSLHLSGLFPTELSSWLVQHHQASYRGQQIFQWIHRQTVQDFSQMTNLPKSLQTKLREEFGTPLPLKLVTLRLSQDGTEKYLFALNDGATIESVLIPEEDRQTLCVSSQVGCAMNCSFCATGKSGFMRNLSAGEIVAQVLWVENRLKDQRLTLSNVVYMGMGEPLANYNAVIKSIRLLNDPQGLNFGARRITISTCGLVPQIRRLAQEGVQVNLAISLHAVTDQSRSAVMPINKSFPISELLDAANYFSTQTGRRVSFEYALIAGFNDGLEQANQLKNLLRTRLCHVNLIPVNPVGSEERPSSVRIKAFAQVLEQGGVQVSIRKERGTDIEAACGQLRQSMLEE